MTHTPRNSVARSVYESAVQGRRSFREAYHQAVAERDRLKAINVNLQTAVRDLLDQISSLTSYELTTDIDRYKAEACWEDAQRFAREELAKAKPA